MGSTQTWSSLDLTEGSLDGDVRNGFEGDRLRLFLRVPDTFAILCEVSFEGLN